jgi:carbamate kinase
MLALESAADPAIAHPYPFDVLGAQSQGMIGYWLLQAPAERAAPGRRAACLVSRTLAGEQDAAFGQPSKFVGRGYDEQQVRGRRWHPGGEARRHWLAARGRGGHR